MKQKLAIILIAYLSNILNVSLKAQCGLDQVGTPNFVTNTNMSCMAVAPTGTVYTFFYNTGNNKYELYKSGLGSGSSLVTVISTSSTARPAMAISKTGKVSVFLRDDNAGKVGKLYYLSGSSLIQQGGNISTGIISDLSITFDSFGNEYVAYTDQSNGNFATVKKWNPGGSSWDPVGVGGIAHNDVCYLNSIAVTSNDLPVLAFKDFNAGNVVGLVKFDGSGWNYMSSIGSNINGLNLKVTSDDNFLVGYVETSGNVFVQKFDGSSWVQLGSNVSNMSVNVGDFELGLDDADSPMFVGIQSGTFFPIIYRYDGFDWVNQGNLSSFASSNSKIGFDKTGAPYFQFSNTSTNNAANIKTIGANVYITSQPTSTLVCDGSNGSFSVAINGTITPTYQWQVSYGGPFVSAITPYYNTTTQTTTFVAMTSMNQDKLRAIVDIGCKNIISNTTTLTVAVNPTVTTTVSQVSCFGGANGSITTTVTGGIAPYTYNWSSGPTTAHLLNIAAGTYSVNIKDANNCKTSITETITQPSAIVSSIAGTQTICAGKNTTLTVNAVGGTPPFTFNWSPSSSLNTSTLATVVASPTSSIIYTVTLIDANACTNTTTVNITVNNPLPFTISPASPIICQGAIVNMTVSPNNTYTLLPGGSTGDLFNISPSSTTIYTVQGIDVNGCFGTQSYPVTVNTNPIANAGSSQTITCANPTRTLSGTGGVTYSWSGPGIVSGAATANPVVNTPGLYSLTVTSAAGCVSSPASVSVFQNITTPNVTSSNTGSLNCSINSANVIASTTTSPVSYNWTGIGITAGAGTGTISVNQGGTYNYTVTNTSNGCTTSGFQTIIQNTLAPSVLSGNTGPLTCSTTTATVYASTTVTPVSYNWTGAGITAGAGTATININISGTYNYTVTNTNNNCFTTGSQNVAQNALVPGVSASNSGTLNCVTNTVALNGTPASGVTYTWTGPGIVSGTNAQNAIANLPGTYTLTVKSIANGCTNSATTSVSQNTIAPTISMPSTQSITCSMPIVNLVSSAVPSTCTPVWSGGVASGVNSFTATASSANIYTLTITNPANGCIKSGTVQVVTNTISPSISASTSNTLTCATVTTQVIVSTTTTPVSYNWSGPGILFGNLTSNATVNLTGLYSVTVTNTSNGCSTTTTTAVSENTSPPTGVSAGPDQTLSCLNSSVTLSGSVSSPTNAVINWQGGVCGTNNTLITSACIAGSYTLVATDPNNGCFSIDIVDVFPNAGAPDLNVSATNSLNCTLTTADISAITTATNPISYSWSGPGIVSGFGSSMITVNAPGTYSINLTDLSSSCVTSSLIAISQDITAPNINLNATSNIICEGDMISITASGADSYLWDGGSTSSVISPSPLLSTSYSVTGTNLNGCSSSASITINVNPLPVISISGNTVVCANSTSSLTATGAVSYNWNTGSTSSLAVITPSISETYTVTGTDVNNCISSQTISVNVIASKDIFGNVTSSITTSGNVTLYKYTALLSKWDSIATVPFSSSYTFNNVDSALYVVRAVPSSTNIQVTYGDSAISWQDATIINHGCSINSSQNIKLIPLENIGLGSGTISGTIYEGQGFGQRFFNEGNKPTIPGGPIGGIIVKGGKNPGGQMFTQTTTNAAGEYTLVNVPDNTLGEEYFIYVDIPGLDTSSTYHFILSPGSNQLTGLDFSVDSMYINPVGIVTGLQTNSATDIHKLSVFPNPSKNFIYIQYELLKNSKAEISLFDILGHKIETILPEQEQIPNKYRILFNTSKYSNGVYFIKTTINNSTQTTKLLINE